MNWADNAVARGRLARVLITLCCGLGAVRAGAVGSWGPHLDLEGKVGSDRSLGRLDLFVPFAQDERSMTFLDLRGVVTDRETEEGNLGVGHRRIMGDWIWGGYAFYDRKSSRYNNWFDQLTLGMEALTASWEFRINGYLPYDRLQDARSTSRDAVVVTGGTTVRVEEQNLVYRERPLYGVDADVGFTHSIDKLDFRLRGGAYWFDNNDVEPVKGPFGRFEVVCNDPFDLDGWQLAVGVEGRYDGQRESQGSILARVRVPLSRPFAKAEAPRRRGLAARMLLPIRRDVDVISQEEETPDVRPVRQFQATNPATNGIVAKIQYFTNGGAGDGSAGAPTSLTNAIANGGTDAILVGLENGNGDVSGAFTLLTGQMLTAPGVPLALNYTKDGKVCTVNYAPAVGQAAPKLVDNQAGAALLTLADKNVVQGLSFDGGGQGDPIISGVNIQDARITSNASTFSGGATGIRLDNPTGTVEISNNRFTSLTQDGVSITNVGGALTLNVTNNTASNLTDPNAPGAAVDFLDVTAVNGGNLTASIANNTVDSIAGSAVTALLQGTANGAFTVSGNRIAQTGAVTKDGVALAGDVDHSGTLQATVSDNAIGSVAAGTGPGDWGVVIDTNNNTTLNAVTISGNTIARDGNGAIALNLSQTNAAALTISNNTVSGSGGAGIGVQDTLSGGVTITADGNRIDGAVNGIALQSASINPTSLQITNAVITGPAQYGISVFRSMRASAVAGGQVQVNVDGLSLSGAFDVNPVAFQNVSFLGTGTTTFSLANSKIDAQLTGANIHGVDLQADGPGTTTLSITNTEINGNRNAAGQHGVAVAADGFDQTDVNVTIDANSEIHHWTGNGVNMTNNATGAITPNIQAQFHDIDGTEVSGP